MTALLYFLVAVLAAALATRAWVAEPDEPARQAFLGLGWAVALAYASFALSLVPGLSGLRVAYMATGCSIPAFALWTVDRLFPRSDRPSPLVLRTFAATAVVVGTAMVLHVAFYRDLPRSSPPEVLAGAFAFGTFALALRRLWQAHEDAGLHVEKVRLRYLLAVAGGAVLFTAGEQLARNLAAPVDPTALAVTSRGVVLQGAIPPFSVLFTGVGLYFLYQTLIMYRLLDLHELASRVATLVVSAFLLVVVDGVTVLWVDTLTDYPFHGTFQIFLASLMFLAAYGPIRDHVSWWSNRLINQRGQQLSETLGVLRAEIPTTLSGQELAEALLSRLHASGRVPSCAVYLWNEGLDAYSCAGWRGSPEQRPLEAVAVHPFTRGFAEGQPWYVRSAVARRARHDASHEEIRELMEAMNADLALPFQSGEVVLGWMALRDEEWSDGFSADEIQRLREVANQASLVLKNIQAFERLEEEHRLAALGAMAAGLAHEIRNPLAGIKGAAQFLQGSDLPDDAHEMLQVVISESDRLNLVVSQFLDYARTADVQPETDHVNALVSHAVTVLRAQGLPEDVELREHLAGDLPPLEIDRSRLSQVLLNLLQNALQAMPGGGILEVSTRRRLVRGERTVEIAVRDTGQGIAPEHRDQLFTPFFTTKRDGTGLGLAICQRIVQAHGGEVEVLSEPDRGSTFLVRLPWPRRDEAPPEATGAALSPGRAEDPLRAR